MTTRLQELQQATSEEQQQMQACQIIMSSKLTLSSQDQAEFKSELQQLLTQIQENGTITMVMPKQQAEQKQVKKPKPLVEPEPERKEEAKAVKVCRHDQYWVVLLVLYVLCVWVCII